jgi:hypothetical protein
MCLWLTANGEKGRVFCACAQLLFYWTKTVIQMHALLRMFIRCRTMFSECRVQEVYAVPLTRPLIKVYLHWLAGKLYWSWPAQWSLVPSPTGLMTLCLTALGAFRIPGLHWLAGKLSWPCPAQWSLVTSPTGLTTLFYCLTGLGTFRIPDFQWFLSSSVNTYAPAVPICWSERPADHRRRNPVQIKITNKYRVICEPKPHTKVTEYLFCKIYSKDTFLSHCPYVDNDFLSQITICDSCSSYSFVSF